MKTRSVLLGAIPMAAITPAFAQATPGTGRQAPEEIPKPLDAYSGHATCKAAIPTIPSNVNFGSHGASCARGDRDGRDPARSGSSLAQPSNPQADVPHAVIRALRTTGETG